MTELFANSIKGLVMPNLLIMFNELITICNG